MSEVTRKVYEITENLRRDLISESPKKLCPKELDGLYEELSKHYEKNFDKIALEIKEKGMRTQYWGSIVISDSFEFSKKAILYSDVLLLEDKLLDMIGSRKIYKQEELVLELRKVTRMFNELKPLAENNMLVLFPNASKWKNVDENILKKVSERDARIIRERFTEIEREFMPKFIERMYKRKFSQVVIKEFGGLKSFIALGRALQINTSLISSKFFRSELVTDRVLGWDNFNAVINKRRPKTRTPLTAQALVSMKLPFLRGADIETILKVRKDHADIFETWRNGWGSACSGLERITDLSEFNEELKHICSEVINPSLEKLDRWRGAVRPLGGIFKGLGTVPVTFGAFFGNLPLGLIGAAFVEPLALEYGKDLAQWLVDNAMRRNFVYFLWKVKEAP